MFQSPLEFEITRVGCIYTSSNDFWLLLRNDRDTQKEESLYMLINLATTGPELDEFNPDRSISNSLNSDPGGRHIHGPAAKTSLLYLSF